MTVYAVITFHSTHFSLKAKKVLEKSGLPFETIPVPREFSSDCGFCSKILWEYREAAEKVLRENHVDYDKIYRWERDEEKERKKSFQFV
jgi:hypothetical protein